MIEKAEKKPILYEVIIIIAGFMLALIFGLGLQILGSSYNEFNMAVGRILAGLILLLIFRKCFDAKKQFSGIVIALPALLFVAWNIFNHFASGGGYDTFGLDIFILGIAPAIFEEVIFRGIFIHNLKASGKSDMAALLISAAVFGVIHLTNAVNGDIAQALVQTGYALVVGLIFGAIYIKSGDLLSLIIVHALIDITNRVFLANDNTSTGVLILFVVVLLAEAAYAIWLVSRKPKGEE